MDYKITVKWDELGDGIDDKDTPIEESESKATPLKSNDMMKQLQTAAVIYGLGRQASQMAVNYMSSSHQIRGESLKAERLQTRFSNATNNIGLGLGIGMSVMTGNPIAIALTAYGLAQRAFNLAMETRKYANEISLDRYKSQYYQQRLVKDISEVR